MSVADCNLRQDVLVVHAHHPYSSIMTIDMAKRYLRKLFSENELLEIVRKLEDEARPHGRLCKIPPV